MISPYLYVHWMPHKLFWVLSVHSRIAVILVWKLRPSMLLSVNFLPFSVATPFSSYLRCPWCSRGSFLVPPGRDTFTLFGGNGGLPLLPWSPWLPKLSIIMEFTPGLMLDFLTFFFRTLICSSSSSISYGKWLITFYRSMSLMRVSTVFFSSSSLPLINNSTFFS